MSSADQVSVCIPARFGSTRFPGKPLARLRGKPLIQHVYESAQQATGVGEIVIVTDHDDIHRTVKAFGGDSVLMTEPCRTGTDRVARIADRLQHEVVVNLQADEIPMHPALLTDLIQPFMKSSVGMGTLKRPLHRTQDFHNPSIVKVVTDRQGRALYFSRSSIPCWRDGHTETNVPLASMHLGIYIFRKPVLQRLAGLASGVLEEAEKLEQLRALENGIPIRVWETAHGSLRIDCPEDLPAAELEFDTWHSLPDLPNTR